MSLTVQTNSQPPALSGMSFEQEKLVRDMYCKDASNDEVAVFLHICRHTKLDPILKQIYFIPRYDKDLKRNKYTPQTSIDGLRLIADRTGCYSPGPSPKFDYAPNGELRSATSYVMKRTPDGTWHTIEATAYMDEQRGTGPLWNSKPRIMLAKCFDEETEVLTEFGFKKFSDVNGRIMQVTENGLKPVMAVPFSQPYIGDMIANHSQHLDFCVTPNHDMITTSGKIEAGLMYDQCRSRPTFFIPRICSEDLGMGLGFTQQQFELAAALLCDGEYVSQFSCRLKVSRPHKVAKIKAWNLHKRESVRNVAGKSFQHSCGRVITTKSDQIEFGFDASLVHPLIQYKKMNHEAMIKMNSQEAKWFIDAWVNFDGNGGSGGGSTCTRRIFSSDIQYISQIEVLANKAGYCVSKPTFRTSDLSSRQNLCISLSDTNEISLKKRGLFGGNLFRQDPSLVIEQNKGGIVWCVKVPSGAIIVRRNGFSFICGNCSEAICIKKGFPAETAGLSIPEEFGDKPIEDVSLVISQEQCDEIYAIGVQIPDLMATCLKKLGCKDFSTMPIEKFAAVKDTLERALERKKEQEFRAAQDGENV